MAKANQANNCGATGVGDDLKTSHPQIHMSHGLSLLGGVSQYANAIPVGTLEHLGCQEVYIKRVRVHDKAI